MKLHSTRIKGFGPFNDVTLDFDALPSESKFIALCGDNGEGKSTLIDLLVDGTHWREWPRVSGARLDYAATSRDSLIETVTTIGGKTYTVRHLVDAVSGKGESAVYCNGEALTKSAKLTEFYAWARENFPAKSVVRSSIVSHPAYGSFVSMKPTSRKDVILLALGVEGIEKLAAAARKRRDAAVAVVGAKREALNEAIAAAGVDAAEQELACCEHELHTAGFCVAEAQQALDVAKQLAGDSALARQRYEEQKAARDELVERHACAERELAEVRATLAGCSIGDFEAAAKAEATALESAKSKLASAEATAQSLRIRREAAQRQLEDRYRVQLELNRATTERHTVQCQLSDARKLLGDADSIRSAVARTRELEAMIAEKKAESSKAAAEHVSEERNVSDLAKRISTLKDTGRDLSVRIVKLEKSLSQAPAVERAVEQRDKLEQQLTTLREQVVTAEHGLDELRNQRVSDASERIVGLRAGLENIASAEVSFVSALRDVATNTLDADNDAIALAAELPGKIRFAKEIVDDYRARAALVDAALKDAESLARLMPRVAVEREALAESTKQLEALRAEGRGLETELSAARARRDAAYAALGAAHESALVLSTERLQLATLASMADALAGADARASELTARLEVASGAVERLTEELEALPEPEPVPAAPDVDTLRRALAQAEKRDRDASSALSAAKAKRATLEPIEANLRVEVTDYAKRLADTQDPTPPESAPDVSALEADLETARREQTEAAKAVGAAKAALDAAKAAEVKAEALRGELATAEVEAADWTRLAVDLGRKGLQATLVDSAGPELTRATNDLLHTCFGTRWTVSYETQRVNGNGDVSEAYDIRIIDTERGRDGVVEDLSDGERTIIASAASLALAELACKSAGFEEPTLFFDESSAALSAERRPMWLAMIRRAAKHVNASRVVVVSHSEDIQDLCDAKIRVANGQLEVSA